MSGKLERAMRFGLTTSTLANVTRAVMRGATMRIVRKPELARKVGLHPGHLAKLERDGKFPKRVKLGANSVGWVEEEIDAWLAERAAERAADQPASPREANRSGLREHTTSSDQ
jgi:prophage regulatory protein